MINIPAGKDLLPLDKVKGAVYAVCADWYSLAIQLDIDHSSRKVWKVLDACLLYITRLYLFKVWYWHILALRLSLLNLWVFFFLYCFYIYIYLTRWLRMTTCLQKLDSMLCYSLGWGDPLLFPHGLPSLEHSSVLSLIKLTLQHKSPVIISALWVLLFHFCKCCRIATYMHWVRTRFEKFLILND